MLIAAFGQYFFGIAIFLSSIFLILLVLVQRGRGGGLTGALGGPGGQSAFGTKAGDLFTRITVGVASFWILLCALSVILLKSPGLPTLGAGTANTATVSGTVGGVDTSDAEGGETTGDSDLGLGSESPLELESATPPNDGDSPQAEIMDLPSETDVPADAASPTTADDGDSPTADTDTSDNASEVENASGEDSAQSSASQGR